ncbi:MAG: alpha-galactosidase, partial [Acidimicrobiales bacterium]
MTFRSHGSLITATTETTQFVLDTTRGVPELLYIGPPLEPTDLDDLAGVLERPRAKAALDVDTPAQILPEHGSGWQGQPGLRGHRPDGSGWAPRFSPERVDFEGDRCSVRAVDTIAELAATTEFDAMPDSVRIRVRLENLGETTYQLDECTMAIPFADEAAEVVHLTGRWSHEFQITRTPLTTGALRFDNRRGRTSHDRVPAVFVTSSGATNTTGSVLGVALGWSGNTIVTVEALTSGHRVVQMGEQLSPGELQLEPGESYTSPWMEVATSAEGLNGVSQAFHRSIRTSESVPGVDRPRPVVLNTWEAVYFNHDLETLTALADAGAEVGVERFVLDDGWFHGRRDDTAGLGDWWVDEHVWPDGLGPLVDHVTGLGLEFGLWFEPEMVNRDSDLYRTHPEWVLSTPGYEPVEGRNQLVLDLGRAEVVEYLREKIHAVLSSYDISYVKWDMNRDLVHASSGSRAGTHHFMHGVYRLWD